MDAAEMDVARASAVEGDTEEISISLRAVPSVEAFVRVLETAGLWTQAMHWAWQPWFAAMRGFAHVGAPSPRHRAMVHRFPRRSAASRIRSAYYCQRRIRV